MKRWILLVAALMLVLPATPVEAEDSETLKGRFLWSKGPEGDLEAVFTPTGPDAWDVSFHFRFRGRDHVYSGTAQGSLAEGELKGTVKNEDERRSFTFSGRVKDDKFEGAHSETTGGSTRSTGTLTLSR
jgi:hypothetical protein